jgi:hypothetical protein
MDEVKSWYGYPPLPKASDVYVYMCATKKNLSKKGGLLAPSTLIGQLRLKPLLSVAIPVLSKKVKLSVY